MPEYYLTDAEFEILSQQAEQIFQALPFKDQKFQIVELGAGDGLKTTAMLKGFLKAGAQFTYEPVDISSEALRNLEKRMKSEIPDLDIQVGEGDYFEMLEEFSKGDVPMLVLFLGSNIGNYTKSDAIELLMRIRAALHSNDCLLTGFDLRKNPLIINRAYADPHGVTKRFNLNLLHRMNRELGAHFQIDKFDFYAYYDHREGEVLSYLVSTRPQKVMIEAFGQEVEFDSGELIFTEYSRKFNQQEIEKWSKESGFSIHKHFLDCKHYFCDSLWKI